MELTLLDFTEHGDSRGQLIALENNKDIPFAIKRVYYIYDTGTNVRRGYHAHKKLEQVLICVHGSCHIHLDDGYEMAELILDTPTQGLYLHNRIWREMYDFSEGAVLLVLASEKYDENDYIRDYQKFVDEIRSTEKE